MIRQLPAAARAVLRRWYEDQGAVNMAFLDAKSAQAGASSMTLGEYRVGISFNPGGDKRVDEIKRAAADLIDLINAIEERAYENEVARLKTLAMTDVETAAMWAVKAVTKPAR